MAYGSAEVAPGLEYTYNVNLASGSLLRTRWIGEAGLTETQRDDEFQAFVDYMAGYSPLATRSMGKDLTGLLPCTPTP
jgi:hypothetical protein